MASADQSILVTGGTGKTGRRLVARLRTMGYAPRVATRQARHPGEVHFNWMDPACFDAALDGVRAAYLVAPPSPGGTLAAMRPFLDHAMQRSGVQRFVLLSASSLDEGGPMMGAVHAYLRLHAPQWVVLRPTWFMQNFSEGQHLPTIRRERTFYSATEDGQVPLINAEDIAAVAARALTDPSFASRDLVLTGPQLLSYDEVAAMISEATDRPVVHRRLSESEVAARFEQGGLPESYAKILAAMDVAIARGSESRITREVPIVTGQDAGGFASFAQTNAKVWHPAVGRT